MYAYNQSLKQAEKLDRWKNAYTRQTRYAVAARERARSLAQKNFAAYEAATRQAEQALQDARSLAADIREGFSSAKTGATLPGIRRQLNMHLDERPWGHLLQCALHCSGVLLLSGLCLRVLFRLFVLARLLNPVSYLPSKVS